MSSATIQTIFGRSAALAGCTDATHATAATTPVHEMMMEFIVQTSFKAFQILVTNGRHHYPASA